MPDPKGISPWPYPADTKVQTKAGTAVPHKYDGFFPNEPQDALIEFEGVMLQQQRAETGEDSIEPVQTLKDGAPRWQNCFTNAALRLGLIESESPQVWLGSEGMKMVVKESITKGLLQDAVSTSDEASDGALVIYTNEDGAWTHAGVLQDNGYVIADRGDVGVYRHRLNAFPKSTPTLFFNPGPR